VRERRGAKAAARRKVESVGRQGARKLTNSKVFFIPKVGKKKGTGQAEKKSLGSRAEKQKIRNLPLQMIHIRMPDLETWTEQRKGKGYCKKSPTRTSGKRRIGQAHKSVTYSQKSKRGTQR